MRLIPIAAASLAAVSAAAQPADNAAPLAAARAFDDAQFRRDRAALEAQMASDFLIVHGSGKVGGRAEFIDGFTKPGVTFTPFAITDRMFLRVSADVAVAGGDGRVAGTENGKPFAEHFRYSDTFVRRDGKWLVVFTQVTPLP